MSPGQQKPASLQYMNICIGCGFATIFCSQAPPQSARLTSTNELQTTLDFFHTKNLLLTGSPTRVCVSGCADYVPSSMMYGCARIFLFFAQHQKWYEAWAVNRQLYFATSFD